MTKLIHYILIALMLNLSVAVYAEDTSKECDWKIIEETKDYVMENCNGETGFQARIRSKPLDDSEGTGSFVVKGPKENPIKEFKDKVAETPKIHEKVEKIEKIEEEVIATQDKIKKVVVEKQEQKTIVIDQRENQIVELTQNYKKPVKDFDTQVEEKLQQKKLAEIDVADTKKPEVKKQLEKVEQDKNADKKLVQKAEEQAWEEVDKIAEKTPGTWRQIHEMFPALIVENEKIKAAELDYEAAVEALKSEYSAYYPQVTITIGNNWEDDRTPAKGTYPDNTITHDSKQGVQKSITVTQMIWDAGRTTAVIDKAKATAQQTYMRLELVKEDVLMEGINAWINLKKSYNTWQANKKVENNAKITLTMTIEKVKKGEASKMEQLQIEQQYRTYQTLTMTSQLAYDSAMQRFQNVWRFKALDVANMPMPVADLLGMIPDSGSSTVNNTSLRIASMDVDIAQFQILFDEAEFKPRIDGKLSYTEKDGELAGGFDTDNSRKEEWRADITATWKIFGGFKNKHLTNADKARLRAATNRYDDTKRQTDEQFKNAWNNYVLVEKNLETLKRTVEINDEMYKLTLKDFQAGNSPIMAVFGMKTAHLMSEVAYENAKLDWMIARFQLHKVLGQVNPIL
jgi:outer membrane protein TolC